MRSFCAGYVGRKADLRSDSNGRMKSFADGSSRCFAIAAASISIFTLMLLPAGAQNRIELRSLVQRDCGLNLNIAGGFGGSPNDPIVVNSLDPLEVASTEMLILRCIGRGRSILWRTLSGKPIESDGKWLAQVKIETKEINSTEIVRQRENYYFDVSAADPKHGGLSLAPGFIDPKAGLTLAYEIGWLHLDGVTNNEPKHPGLGYSLSYGAPGIKATIFVYDLENSIISSDLDQRIAKTEFTSAVSDMLEINPKYRPIGPVASNGAMLRQDFHEAGDKSIVALAVVKNRFVKIRLTATADPGILESVEESIDALAQQLHNQ